MKQETALIPTHEELGVYQVMAKTAHQSKFFDKLGGEAGILSIMLLAREMGIKPVEAIMGGINVIMGKAEISPRLMNTLIRKAGHKLQIEESTNAICKIRGTRSDTKEEYTSAYTIEDARNAGLVKSGGGWEKYPSDMLFARCLSRLARRLFADVISSSYVEGEISDSEPYGNPVQLLGKTEQLPSVSNKVITNEEAAKVVEDAEIVSDNIIATMTCDEFVAKLKEKFGDKYSFERMEEYLTKLEADKGVKISKIMDQALNPSLIARFCRGWQNWNIEKEEKS